MLNNKSLKGFTIIELLVSMTLTGILVVFAFLGYNQIQKLFLNYAKQSEFISEYNQLNKALFILSDKANEIEKKTENSVVFKTDSNETTFEINEKVCLLKFKSHTDTFKIASKEKQFEFVQINNSNSSNLITSFMCEVFYQSQKFHVSFHKQYDASRILKLNQDLLPKDELY
jgi:prepilin-type N-terminal cleavage/methylation domain-containing protein